MSPATGYALVALSSITHAYWNFLLKRAGGGNLFLALSKLAEVVLVAPFFLWAAAPDPAAPLRHWPIVLGGAALVLANYLALARAYRAGDLSLAYPISRGAILLFLPALGWLAFRERISMLGAVALALVVTGIALVPLRRFSRPELAALVGRLSGGTAAWAILAGLAAAGYTVWDKRALATLPAIVYFYAYTVVLAAALAVMELRRPRAEIAAEWRAHWWAIVRVAALNAGSYLLVLLALRAGTSSYVIAIRQLGIAWGVLLGARLLGETIAPPQRVGVAVLVAGCLLVAFAR